VALVAKRCGANKIESRLYLSRGCSAATLGIQRRDTVWAVSQAMQH